LSIKKNSTTRTNVTVLQGPSGDSGPAGIAGPAGPRVSNLLLLETSDFVMILRKCP